MFPPTPGGGGFRPLDRGPRRTQSARLMRVFTDRTRDCEEGHAHRLLLRNRVPALLDINVRREEGTPRRPTKPPKDGTPHTVFCRRGRRRTVQLHAPAKDVRLIRTHLFFQPSNKAVRTTKRRQAWLPT
eukprot:935454-Pyramimonas_sp.AAC.1